MMGSVIGIELNTFMTSLACGLTDDMFIERSHFLLTFLLPRHGAKNIFQAGLIIKTCLLKPLPLRYEECTNGSNRHIRRARSHLQNAGCPKL